jgi:manganese/zinc/iron transport system permease protein
MSELIPPFSWHDVFVVPWTEELYLFGWIVLMGFLVTAACGLIGNYLILRRMALVGDAISHSVLPGIAIAFLIAQHRGSLPLFVGALVAGMLTTVLIEFIHQKSRIKQDSAIGITFSCFFAFGVILISLFTSAIDLDADCVLFGEIGWIPFEAPYVEMAGVALGPPSVVRMAVVLLLTAGLIVLFYKELLISSFDPGLSTSLGFNARAMHYALMAILSVVVVSAFQAVGAILVIAMLILPGATAALLSDKLTIRLLLSIVHAAGSAVGGIHLAIAFDASVAPGMVVSGCFLFGLAWVFSPRDGLGRLRKARPVAAAS